MDQFNKVDFEAPRWSRQTKALRSRQGRSALPREKKRARRVYNSSDFLLANNHEYARAKTSLPLSTDMFFYTLIYGIQQCNRRDLISIKKNHLKIFKDFQLLSIKAWEAFREVINYYVSFVVTFRQWINYILRQSFSLLIQPSIRS